MTEIKPIIINLLKDRIMNCKACALHNCRKNVVFGEGSVNAPLMIVGEGPGADEDETGKPFVGKAGQKLDQILSYYKLDRKKDVFITNSILCHPPNNRQPLYEEEIIKCNTRLLCQISIIKPKVILGLGATSAKALIGDQECKKAGSLNGLLGHLHFIVIDNKEYPVLFSFHPSYLLRKSQDQLIKSKAQNHWNKAIELMKEFADIDNQLSVSHKEKIHAQKNF